MKAADVRIGRESRMFGVGLPLLKWTGGKRQLVPELMKHVPRTFNRYLEPFVGGGALFFYLAGPASPIRSVVAMLNDSNDRLIRMYRGVRDDVSGVVDLLKTYKYEKAFYYRMREMDIDTQSDTRVAAWFIYLNRTGFNGLYRVNRENGFNVPFGRYTNPTICDEVRLHECSRALNRAAIDCMDFEAHASRAVKGDLVYFDPPYVPLSATSLFTSYTKDGFTMADQVRLRDCAQQLKRRGVHVILSNSSAPAVYELYKGFTIHEIDARRAINSDASKRGPTKELIIT